MDNARYHVSKKVLEELKFLKLNAITTPPYTPELNPVEISINYIKSKIKKISR